MSKLVKMSRTLCCAHGRLGKWAGDASRRKQGEELPAMIFSCDEDMKDQMWPWGWQDMLLDFLFLEMP